MRGNGRARFACDGMIAWFAGTLRNYPELAIFISLCIGFRLGPLKIRGLGLGNVTATLLAGVAIGQFDIPISPDVKSVFFALFVFSVGYGVGPQVVRGLGKEGPKQVLFSVIVVALSLATSYVCARLAGLNLGYALGLYGGSQTASASLGVATEQINHLAFSARQAKTYTDDVAVGFAVTYIWGAIGSALLLASLGPRLLGIDLAQACREYEQQLQGGSFYPEPGIIQAYRVIEARAYHVTLSSGLAGKPVRDLFPHLRVFVEGFRRDGKIIPADPDSFLQDGDTAVISGPRPVLIEHLEPIVDEIEDRELLTAKAQVLEIFVTNKILDGMTVRALLASSQAWGIYLLKIIRSQAEIPVLPNTEILRGDILTIAGSKRHVDGVIPFLGHADRPGEVTDIAFIGGGVAAGEIVGSLTYTLAGIPFSLSASGGVLIAGPAAGLVPGGSPNLRPYSGAVALADERPWPECLRGHRRH